MDSARGCRLPTVVAFSLPAAVMAGQITYLVALTATLAVTLRMGMTGWKMSVCAINTATVCTTVAVYAALKVMSRRKER